MKYTKLTTTVRCCKLDSVMTDSFYINGANSPKTSAPSNKTFTRTTRSKVGIFAVSDGFGEDECASFASYKTVTAIKRFHEKMSSVSFEKVLPVVNDYLDSVNSLINSFDSPSGASLAMLIVNQGIASSVNVGNCRTYLFRYGRLCRLSNDHTESQRLISIGALTASEEKTHPAKKILTKYLGMNAGAKAASPHVSNPTPLEKNDMFLICSNGLTDALSDDRISYILSLKISDERLVQRLISEAVARGADDNITAMIVRVGTRSKTSKAGFKLAKLTLAVIVSAFLIGFIISSFKSCSTQSRENSEPVPTPTPGLILRTEQ